MLITVSCKLTDILQANYINSWLHFCDKYGVSEWCLAEGSEDITVNIDIYDAKLYGLI